MKKNEVLLERKSRMLTLAELGLHALIFALLFFIVNTALGQDGKVTREVWTGISGTTIDKIPLTTTPNSTGMLTSIQAPVNTADNYGQRIKGYIIPSTTGTYNLYISSDDYGELWLSTNSEVANKVKIASVTGWTNSLQWTKYTSQKSAAISLNAGQYYYFEALMKEQGGGDNLAIGWTGPGISSITVIGASNISTTASTADTQAPTAPTSLVSASVTQTSFTLSWTASTDNVGVSSYDVYKDGTLYTNVSSTSANISGLAASTSYSMTVKAKDAAGNVSAASSALSVTTSAETAASTTINFQNLASGQISTNPYVDNSGYKFTGYNSTNGLENLFAENHDNTISIRNGNWQGKIVIEKSDASAFNLVSFDYHGNPWNGTADATVTGTYTSGGTVTSSFTGGATFATLALNWSNLSKVEINYNGGTNNSYGLIDNVVVSGGSVVADTQAPTAPTGLASSSIAQTSFTLSWTASTDNVGVVSYEVFEGSTSKGTTTSTSLNITGLNCNTTYSMTVKAIDAAGNVSTASSALNVTTSACSDTQAPTAPTGLASSSIGQTSFTLSWTASTDNVGVASYDVYKDGTLYTNVTTTSASITALTCNTAYSMTVKAKDAAGNVSASSSALNVTTSACADTQAPTAPTGLASSSIGQTSFTLSWTASTDNVGVVSYEVFEGATSKGTTTSTSMSVTGLSASTTYTMTVKAKDAAGNVSAASSALSVTTNSETTENIVIDFQNLSAGQVSANPYADNSGFKFTGYSSSNGLESLYAENQDNTISIRNGNWGSKMLIEKSDASAFNLISFDYHGDPWNGTADATVTGTYMTGGTETSSYTGGATFATLTLNWINLSKVEINFNGGTNSSYGLIDNVVVSSFIDSEAPTVPTALVASAITQSSFTLSWTASTDNIAVTAYEVFANGSSVGTTSSTSISLSNLAPNTTFAMTVKAKDAAGNLSAASSALSVKTPEADVQSPSTPSGLSASNITTNGFSLSWTASTDNVGVASYEVFAGTVSKGTTTSTSINITGLPCNTAYSMTVKAMDAAGNVSAASSALNVSTLDCSSTPPTSTVEYIGINVGFLQDWEPILYADMFKQISGLRQWEKPWTSTPANLDANGWPTEDAEIIVRHDQTERQQRAGKYQLSFTGQAENISFGYTDVFTVQNKVYNSTTNTTTADLVASTTFSNLELVFTGTSGGVKNVKLMRPTANGSSQSYSTSTLFVPEMVNIMKKFNTLRFMDPTATNGNSQVEWSSRTLPANLQKSQMSWEHVILLCNEVGADAYINIPHKASNDYITKLAQVFKYGSDGVNPYTSVQTNPVYPPLNDNLKLYVEYSNEVWNTVVEFSQTIWNLEAGYNLIKNDYSHPLNFDNKWSASNPPIYTPDINWCSSCSWDIVYRSAAWRGAEASKIFRSVFGDSQMMTRVRPLYCWQADYYGGTPWTATQGFAFLTGYYQKEFGQAPNYFFWGGGGASYSNPTDNCSVLTIDNIWTSDLFNIDTWKPVLGDKFMSSLYGLEYISYEGGPSFGDALGGSASCTIGEQALVDDRMINEVIEHHDKFTNWGGAMETYYVLTHDYRWGFMEDTDNPYHWKRMNAIDEMRARTTRTPITAGKLLPAEIPAMEYVGKLGDIYDPKTGGVNIRGNGMLGYFARTNTDATYNVSFEYSSYDPTTAEIVINGISYGTINLPTTGYQVKVITASVQATLSSDKLHNIAIKNTGAKGFDLWRIIAATSTKKAIINNESMADGNMDAANEVSVFPNPVSANLTVSLSENASKIEVLDMSGHKLKTQIVASSIENIDVASLNQGLYILRVVFDSGSVVNKRFVKQ